MPFTSQLKKQVDLPVWEWTRFAPIATTATSAMCAPDDGDTRYLYYLGATFWRYDTWTDGWQQLATPPTAGVTATDLRYSRYAGYRGNCLGAGASTITLAGLERDTLKGLKIRILAGTGRGQERTITSTSDNTILDHGIVTAASANSIGDSTKRWRINQFIGCQVRLVYGTGQSQVRKVLFNDASNIYVYDANYQQLEPWNNIPFSATAPYALPVVTAGAQATYYIETLVATVDTPWDTVPDASSSYVILSGGIWMLSAAAAAPWSSFQFYDILSDTWAPKTAIGGQLIAALGTDYSIDRTGEVGGPFATGTSSGAGTSRSLVDSSKTLVNDRFANYQIRITGGTGIGQRRRIVGNTATTFYIDNSWDTIPDATSTYTIFGDVDKIYLVGNGQAAMYKYSVENDCWFTGLAYDYGVCANISCSFNGQQPFACTGSRGTTGVSAIASAPTAGGTNYVVGDILTISTGGANSTVRVTSTLAGVVTGLELYRAGTGYTVSSGNATTGGTGTGCTVNITAVSTIGRFTTTTNHNLCTGDTVTFAGCTVAGWNAAYTILCTDSLTTFDVITTQAASPAAAASQSTTVIVDASKNWTVNEHAGKIVNLNVAGSSPTTQSRRIVSNTATSLTVALAITAGGNGTSRYSIQEPWAIGRDMQYKDPTKSNEGWATGGTTTTLVDSTKNWNDKQWINYKVRIVNGTGLGSELTITDCSGSTLTYATQTFTPDATTKYIIMDTFGLATAVTNTTNATITDTTKNWTVNQWAGKRLHITSGTGLGQEITITSNTATVITCTGVFATAPDTNSTYQIYGPPARSTGVGIDWIFNPSLDDEKGKYIIASRGGGSNVMDKYNITTGVWDQTIFLTPKTEILTTGTMYAYDGEDHMYFQRDATGRVFSLDVNTHKVNPLGVIPYAMGTALLGNRMEVISTEDGLKYLYIMRHSGQEMWRLLVWWE